MFPLLPILQLNYPRRDTILVQDLIMVENKDLFEVILMQQEIILIP